MEALNQGVPIAISKKAAARTTASNAISPGFEGKPTGGFVASQSTPAETAELRRRHSATLPSRLIASAARCTGGWHVRHRQPFGSCRSVHQHVPKQELYHATGVGGAVSAMLG